MAGCSLRKLVERYSVVCFHSIFAIMSREDTQNLRHLVTFGLVPLLSVGALYVFDTYMKSQLYPVDEDESSAENGRGMRRTASSFFYDDESEDGDPQGRESTAVLSGPQFTMTNPEIYHANEELSGGPWTSLGLEQPLVVAMVGLPARGKSYIVKMMIRFLTWTGFECQVFNVGSYRRKLGLAGTDASFFSTENKDGSKVREEMAQAVQAAMYEWLHESTSRNRVAFFDATNTTVDRRLALAKRAKSESCFLLFVESICDDEQVLARNYELKLQNDDYKKMSTSEARHDFMQRVRMYEKAYETIKDSEDSGNLSYIKVINIGQKMITRNCTGYLPCQISFFLQNIHIHPRKIYLSLTSMDVENTDFFMNRQESKKKGRLSHAGKKYSEDLARFLEKQRQNYAECKELLVLSGASRVHAETLFHLRMVFSCYSTPLLNEMRGGALHGYTRSDIKKKFPDEYRLREKNKLNYRFPGVGGESYLDIIERIRPVIVEIERQRRSVLIVCHVAVLRCIYAYLMGTKLDEMPHLQFKPHHVYELTPGPFGCRVVDHDLSFSTTE